MGFSPPTLHHISAIVGRIQNNSALPPGDPQFRFVGETAVIECNVSQLVSTAEMFEIRWQTLVGGSIPLDRATFTQNNQTLVITNLTIADSQLYQCSILAPETLDRFRLTYRLNVQGESAWRGGGAFN